VVNRDDTQIVFMDTPGFHKARNKLGDYMDNVVRESIADVDAIMLLVEPIPSVGTQEAMLIEQLKATKIPSILVINKIDTLENKEELLAVIAAYSAQHDFAAIVPISAKTGEGVDALFDEVKKYAAPGPQLFPEDMVTDQPERQIMAEIIREKLLWCLDREVPHGTAVEIDRFSEREDSGIIDLEATIYCEKASHKGIIIGKNGAMLKKISTMARNDCEKFMGTKVYLRCWVKVKENWRDSDFLIKNFGYRE
jgi:GTP-binding protein Era